MSTNTGNWAEEKAAQYLQDKGFKIVARNWRTKFCEIDIIASKDDAMHFVEVKYRKSSGAGSGFDYVTTKKQKQLKRAAAMWSAENNYEGDYRIDVVSIGGQTGELKYLSNAVFG